MARCNLDCGEGEGATWCCDTPYTWRWDGKFNPDVRPTFDPKVEIETRTVRSVVDEVAAMGVGLCVVTGGEPLSQRGKVAELARLLDDVDVATEVETNGTIKPGPAARSVAAFNVSPKLANSGVAQSARFKPDVLAALLDTGKARFKFVCSTVADLDDVAAVVAAANIPASAVWVMPSGTDPDDIACRLRLLAEPTIEAGWNLSSRLHVTVWGDRRGV